MADPGWIPNITDAEITQMLEHITPLIARDGTYHTVAAGDPRVTSYAWSNPVTEVSAGSLEVLTRIRTYHSWGHYSMFKPSVAEVFAMIPVELRDQVGAFFVQGPETADDLNREKKALDAGYHVAETILYKRSERVVGEPRTAWDHLNATD